MSQIIQVKSPILAAVTDSMPYIKARKAVERLAQEHKLKVADMPMAIQAMNDNSEIREAIRPRWIDVITGEYHGQRDGDRSYEAWHSVGSLATVNGLEQAFPNVGEYAFMKIDDNEWGAVGKGTFNGQDVARVKDLAELRRGSVPKEGTPYTVALTLPSGYQLVSKDADMKDVLEAHKAGKLIIFESGQLNGDQFRVDDRVLSILGSPKNVESTYKMLFGAKKDGGEGWDSVGSHHRITEVGFDTTRGRLVYLGNGNLGGLNGYYYFNNNGRFFGVSDGVAQLSAGGATLEKSTTQGIMQATLEQTLAIINDPDLNREDMVSAISQLRK